MDIGVQIALISTGGMVLLAVVGIITARMSNKNTKELALIAASNSVELAKIAANQDRLEASHEKQTAAVEGYHKEVNGKMGKLLETTEALGKEKGIAQEKAKN